MADFSVNRVELLGHLGRDAENSSTPDGTEVTRFSVATTRSWKDNSGEWKEATSWSNVVLWRNGKLGAQLLKGKQVFVEGRLETRSYEKDGRKVYVTEVIAERVILLGASSGRSLEEEVARPREGDRPATAPAAQGNSAASATAAASGPGTTERKRFGSR